MKKSYAFCDNVPAFGIDLGTTNSCISVLSNEGLSNVIPLDDGRVTMPSCVLWVGKEDRFIVGHEAYEKRYESNACYSVKTLMGSDTIVTLTDGEYKCTKTPEEISAEILKGLVKKASSVYKDIRDVVITVPAAFNVNQIESTKKAAELANLNVLSIMKEPTSAALAYKLDNTSDNILVYDLGGGTFDVSLVNITNNSSSDSDLFDLLGIESESSNNNDSKSVITVKATRGDNHLGGDDLDKEIYKLLGKKMKKLGCDVPRIKPVDREEMLLKIEKYKKLGDFKSIIIHCDFELSNGTKWTGKVELNDEDVERATKVIYNKTKPYIDDLIDNSISTIVLVGGSTKNKYLKQFIASDYPKFHICDYLNPDEAVARGAAVQAKRVKFGSDDLEVFDIIGNNIGVLADGRIHPVIFKATPIPCAETKTFTTTQDNQEQIRVAVYEGSRIHPEECTYLGDLIINDIPKGKKGEVPVQVTLMITSDGLLTAKVSTDNETKEVQLINVLGKKMEKDNNSDLIMFSRWEKVANDLDEPDKSKLLDLIIKAKTQPNAKRDVINFLRTLK